MSYRKPRFRVRLGRARKESCQNSPRGLLSKLSRGLPTPCTQSAGYAKSEGLHPGKRRHTNTCWKAEGAGIKAAEVVNASIVHCEDRRQGQVIEVNPELGIVSSKGPRKVITELVSLLRSLNEGVRLPSDKCEPGNVGSYV